jgi:hypothetical protein
MTWRTAAALIVVAVAPPARADSLGDSTREVCNQGTVTTEVVVASNFSHLVHPWVVEGTSLAPGDCKGVYSHRLGQAFLAFGWLDSRGRWVAGTVESLPDLGAKDQGLAAKRTPVLSRARRMLCVRRDRTWYGIKHGDDFPASCDGFDPADGEGSGPYVPVEAVLWFDPEPSRSSSSGYTTFTSGGKYFLNIAPGKSGNDVHATLGTPSGPDAPPPPAPLPPPLSRPVDEEARRQRENAEDARRFLAEKARTDALRRSVSDFRPDWVGQSLIVTGTVSTVQLQGPSAIVHFSDAPNDGFVICMPAQLLRGVNLAELGGKRLEFRGAVTKASCLPQAAGIRAIVWREVLDSKRPSD